MADPTERNDLTTIAEAFDQRGADATAAAGDKDNLFGSGMADPH